MGDAVNVFLDNLDAFLWRLMQFPLVFQLLMWLVVAGLIWWFFFWLIGRKTKAPNRKARLIGFSIALACSLLIAAGVIFDHKWKLMEEEMSRMSRNRNVVTLTGAIQETDLLALADSIKIENQGDSLLKELIYVNAGVQVIRLEFNDPSAVAYLAAIDLTRYDIILDTAFSTKEKTTEFAERFDVEIAVNGEAGSSPGIDAPLGSWVGNYIVNGVPLMMKDNDEHPFFYFNKHSKGYYSCDKEVITRPAPEMYNAIWGRYDLIRNGKIDIDPRDLTKNNRYPRTIVGLDSTGLRLFLMVVDGRRVDSYSAGLTMKQSGQILIAFDVFNAMACDQGGSTNLYIKGPGIVSRPSDGVERAVYTHLGVRSRY